MLTFPFSLNGIPYRWQNAGSGHQQFGAYGGDGTATEVYLCLWEDRFAFRLALLGDISQDGVGNVTVAPGHTHPAYPDLMAQSCEIDPVGAPNSTAGGRWPYAKFTVTYKIPPYPPGTITALDLRDESVESAGELLVTEGQTWKVDVGEPDAGKYLTRDVAKPVSYLNYIVTMFQVTSLPAAAVQLFDCCNDAAFKDFAAFTVVYKGFSAQRKIAIGGSLRWTVKHAFLAGPTDVRKEMFRGRMQLIKTINGDYKFTPAGFGALGVG